MRHPRRRSPETLWEDHQQRRNVWRDHLADHFTLMAPDLVNNPGKNFVIHWCALHPNYVDLASPISHFGPECARVARTFIDVGPSARFDLRFRPRDLGTEETIVGEVEREVAWSWSQAVEVTVSLQCNTCVGAMTRIINSLMMGGGGCSVLLRILSALRSTSPAS